MSETSKNTSDNNEFIIDINNGMRTLKVKGGTTLLRALFSNKIFIPSACGGKAVCGLCRVQINEGGRGLLPQEKSFFTDEEVNNGFRLACQTSITNDMKITLPEKALKRNQFKAKVVSITQLTYDIKGFTLALQDTDRINFKAGQYVQVMSKPYGVINESVSRAYSIASVPSQKNLVELIVRQVPNGICSTYMNQYAKEGDEITINGPHGEFYQRESDEELVFIAGGSGISPIKSIILDIIERKIDRKMTFLFGATAKKDLYYTEFFHSLEKEYSFFKYIPSLSRPEPSDMWAGETGLITEVVNRNVKYADKSGAYLCGSPGMINACVNALKNIGFPEHKIYYDKFS